MFVAFLENLHLSCIVWLKSIPFNLLYFDLFEIGETCTSKGPHRPMTSGLWNSKVSSLKANTQPTVKVIFMRAKYQMGEKNPLIPFPKTPKYNNSNSRQASARMTAVQKGKNCKWFPPLSNISRHNSFFLFYFFKIPVLRIQSYWRLYLQCSLWIYHSNGNYHDPLSKFWGGQFAILEGDEKTLPPKLKHVRIDLKVSLCVCVCVRVRVLKWILQ